MEVVRFVLPPLPPDPTESGPSSVSWLGLLSMAAEWAELPPEEVDRRGRGVETTSVILDGQVREEVQTGVMENGGRWFEAAAGRSSYAATFGLTPCLGRGRLKEGSREKGACACTRRETRVCGSVGGNCGSERGGR